MRYVCMSFLIDKDENEMIEFEVEFDNLKDAQVFVDSIPLEIPNQKLNSLYYRSIGIEQFSK